MPELNRQLATERAQPVNADPGSREVFGATATNYDAAPSHGTSIRWNLLQKAVRCLPENVPLNFLGLAYSQLAQLRGPPTYASLLSRERLNRATVEIKLDTPADL